MNDETTTTTDPILGADAVRAFSRRRLLFGGAAAAAFLAACGNDDDDEATATTTTTAEEDDATTTTTAEEDDEVGNIDIEVARAAVGLELVAVGTYQAALDAATAGDLGEVPPAVATYVETVLGHHQDAADAWNEGLELAGEPPVSDPLAELQATVDEQFAEVTDVAGVVALAMMLEEIASHTYLAALPLLSTPESRRLAVSIQTVDQQHRAILLFASGEYPVPEVFQSTDSAVSL